ncbi:unnamed protein product [Brachionus calyciflorus]|uniref:Uncharacterized protein n=1 Tax=Brachionus calyciflorus TaxID=104777 RepID=A0A814Q3J5_9BILA|nr:unnamed protein product [Brachionus calyciflorus]
MEKIIKETIFKKILNLAFEISVSSCDGCILNYGAQHGHSCLSPFFYNLALEKQLRKMAQAMIEMRFKKNTSTQTADNFDYTFLLSKTKTVRLYKSRSYKDYVLSLSLNKSKKLIVTKSMWNIFKIYIPLIDKLLI